MTQIPLVSYPPEAHGIAQLFTMILHFNTLPSHTHKALATDEDSYNDGGDSSDYNNDSDNLARGTTTRNSRT